MRLFPLLLIPLFLVAFSLRAETESTPTWPTAGAPLPALTVVTADGDDVRVADLLAHRPGLLIFYRGSWCPYCTRHLAALAEVEADLLAAGVTLLAISPDHPDHLDGLKLPYQLLSDRDARAAQALGIAFQVPAALVTTYKDDYGIDLEAAAGADHHLLPHPAVFLVDAHGVIRFAHVNPNYRERLSAEEILAALAQLPSAGK
jgi:peroxiredoxin